MKWQKPRKYSAFSNSSDTFSSFCFYLLGYSFKNLLGTFFEKKIIMILTMRKCFFVSFATAAAYFLTLVLCIVYSSSNNRVRTRHLLLQSYIQLRQSLGSLSQRYRAKNYTDIHESQNISVRPENKNYSYHNAASNYSSTHPKKRSSSSRSYRMWKQIFGKTGTKTKRR